MPLTTPWQACPDSCASPESKKPIKFWLSAFAAAFPLKGESQDLMGLDVFHDGNRLTEVTIA